MSDTELLRALLRKNKIKLWEAPYTNPENGTGQIPDELVAEYSTKCRLEPVVVSSILEELRVGALIRQQSNQVYSSDGKATLKATIVDPSTSTFGYLEKTVCIETALDILGNELQEHVAKAIDQGADSFKLIFGGKLLDGCSLLASQNIKHNSEIICILLTQAEQESLWKDNVSKTKNMIQHLANNNDSGGPMEITDQQGKHVDLPLVEKTALTAALAFHERGRASVAKKQHGRALLFLLEADREFRQCRSEILAAVDNYPILCLDIVWCYLCLRNVTNLPDAEEKLLSCENGFKRTYGPNFERLVHLKKSMEQEKALIARLRLLQGVVEYYKKNYDKAMNYFLEAESTIQELQVDDTKLCEVMSLGYSESDARLALRSTHGDIERAVVFILNQKEDEKKNREAAKEDRKAKKLQKTLGKTANGNDVDGVKYNQLLAMGFSESLALKSLKDANNDIEIALEILRVTKDQHAMEQDSVGSSVVDTKDSMLSETDTLKFQLETVGVPPDLIDDALAMDSADMQAAIDNIISSFDDETQQQVRSLVHKLAKISQDPNAEEKAKVPGTSHDHDPVQSLSEEDKKLYEEMQEEMPQSSNAYLDLVFEEESRFLDQYKQMLLIHA